MLLLCLMLLLPHVLPLLSFRIPRVLFRLLQQPGQGGASRQLPSVEDVEDLLRIDGLLAW